MNLVVKDTLFELPSQGKAYDFKLLPNNSVKIRPFVAADQKVLAGMGGNAYKIYSNLLAKVVLEPKEIETDKMLLSDVLAILYAVRLMSYGPNFTVHYKCENCGDQNTPTVSISELEVKYAEEMKEFQSQFPVQLPDSKDTVVVRLQMLEDEKFVNSTFQKIRQREEGSDDNPDIVKSFIRTALALVSSKKKELKHIMDKTDFIDNLSMLDYQTIIDALNKNDVGIVPDMEHSCKSCQWLNRIQVAVNADFFRPRSK